MMVGCLEIMEYIFMLLVVIHQARRLWHAICMCWLQSLLASFCQNYLQAYFLLS